MARDPLAGKALVVSVQGLVHDDSLLIPAYVVGPRGRVRVVFTLDTGAFEPLLYSPAANAAGLPHGDPLEVGGVGGTSSAYRSTFALELGGVKIEDLPCVVDDSSPSPLLGYRGFEDLGYTAVVGYRSGVFALYR